jgi:hypothetical protein
MILASFLFLLRMAEVSTVRLVEEAHPHRDFRLPRDTVRLRFCASLEEAVRVAAEHVSAG